MTLLGVLRDLVEELSEQKACLLLDRSARTRVEKEIVKLAKDAEMRDLITRVISRVPTKHLLVKGDSRNLGFIDGESVHMVLTSPPYWNLKEYREIDGQLGVIRDYNEFLEELCKVWKEVFRVLVPGGRLVIVVGDVLLSRRKHGRHHVVPLHADIIRQCVSLGFEYLSPIIWYKIGNVKREAPGKNGFLGKPYQPNGIVKNDIEYILIFRKPGYRRIPRLIRLLSTIQEELFKQLYTQVWRIPGEQERSHPAPFPLALAERLVIMNSFVGDTVLDPFVGTGTTMLAAIRTGRNSIGVEIDPEFVQVAWNRISKETRERESVSIELVSSK